MIVLRVARGAWHHAGARWSEWLGGVLLVFLGYQFANDEGLFARTASFSRMAEWADQSTWAIVVLSAGLIRVTALFINGTLPTFRPYSPTLRFLATWVSFVVATSFATGLFYSWLYNGGSSTGWGIYGIYWAGHELRNLYVTRVDMIETARARAHGKS